MRRCGQTILVVLAISTISTLTACTDVDRGEDPVTAVGGMTLHLSVDPAGQMKQHDEWIDS